MQTVLNNVCYIKENKLIVFNDIVTLNDVNKQNLKTS